MHLRGDPGSHSEPSGSTNATHAYITSIGSGYRDPQRGLCMRARTPGFTPRAVGKTMNELFRFGTRLADSVEEAGG
jgi:hypothetical protein